MGIQIDLVGGASKSWVDYALAVGSIITAAGSIAVGWATSRYASAAQLSAKAAQDLVKQQADASAAQLKNSSEAAALALENQIELAGKQIEASYKTAALQSRAAVVSASRQRWIDALREDMADLLAANDAFHGLTHRGSMTQEGQEELLRYEESLTVRRVLLRNRIDLRLNPSKSNHQALIHAIDLWLAATESSAQVQRLAQVRELLKALLRKEWCRVKWEAAGEEPGEPLDIDP